MKLINKKTGEIMQLSVKCENGGDLRTFDLDTNIDKPITLAELNEEWKDYEELKEFWYISDYGWVIKGNAEENMHKRIGNYFATQEEAEQAVEKLKALKRLKDKGFKFVGWQDSVSDNNPDMALFKLDEDAWETDTCDDLGLLFGGEE